MGRARLELTLTIRFKKYWKDLQIPFADAQSFANIDRQVNPFGCLAGGLNSRQLNQTTTLQISFLRNW